MLDVRFDRVLAPGPGLAIRIVPRNLAPLAVIKIDYFALNSIVFGAVVGAGQLDVKSIEAGGVVGGGHWDQDVEPGLTPGRSRRVDATERVGLPANFNEVDRHAAGHQGRDFFDSSFWMHVVTVRRTCRRAEPPGRYRAQV